MEMITLFSGKTVDNNSSKRIMKNKTIHFSFNVNMKKKNHILRSLDKKKTLPFGTKDQPFLHTLAAAPPASAEQGDEGVKELAPVLHTQANHCGHNSQTLPSDLLYWRRLLSMVYEFCDNVNKCKKCQQIYFCYQIHLGIKINYHDLFAVSDNFIN